MPEELLAAPSKTPMSPTRSSGGALASQAESNSVHVASALTESRRPRVIRHVREPDNSSQCKQLVASELTGWGAL